MFLLDIRIGQFHITTGHNQRLVSQDLLQRESIVTVDQVPHGECMREEMRVKVLESHPVGDAMQHLGHGLLGDRGPSMVRKTL